MDGGHRTRRRHRFRGHALAIALLALVVPTGAHADAVERPPSPEGDGLARAFESGRLSEAEHALERALALARPDRARRLFGLTARPDPRGGAPILRDLAALAPALPRARRAEAARILARPTDRRDAIHGYRTGARRVCDQRMCFFWVTKGADAPRLADANRNRLPDWVDKTRATFAAVWKAQIGRFGYRAPRSDATSKNHGPNGRLDIYIADIGAKGLYGYCTTDDPARSRRRSVSSYCVVDDDFSGRQFSGSATGRRALQVTAAHEFFHAVQHGYDWREDLWLMEGTATWIEDEVFNTVNDNRQYLRTSPLGPDGFFNSLDYYDRDTSQVGARFKYGVWIFWRYLSERYGREIVRDVWRLADARGRAPDQYSAQAVVGALAARGAAFGDVVADFGVANATPAHAYREGTAYPSPRPTQDVAVTAAGIARTRVPMAHMSNDYYAFAPSGLAPGSSLTLDLELADPAASPRASALIEAADGSVARVDAVRDQTTGRSTIVVPAFAEARRVTLVLTNGSARFRCWQRSVFSCRGRPVDDVEFAFEATVAAPVTPEPARP